MTTSIETTPVSTRASLASWLSLAVLLISTLYTYADRQIFALQAEPLRKALELSDLQFGMLQGLGHAIFAAIVGYPVAWLSDRFDRRVVLAGCLALWSATVMASGFAGSFTQLFLATSLVGAAEAGMLPIVYALVPELFSGKQRQYANSALVVAGRLRSR
jgi:MFS family permease